MVNIMKKSQLQLLLDETGRRDLDDPYHCDHEAVKVNSITIGRYNRYKPWHNHDIEERLKQLWVESGGKFSSEIAQYVEHSITRHITDRTDILLNLGVTTFRDHKLLHKAEPGKVSWVLGINNLTLLKDKSGRTYVVFVDRDPKISHHGGIEREIAPKGYCYTEPLEQGINDALIVRGGRFDEDSDIQAVAKIVGGRVLEDIVKGQLNNQLVIPEGSEVIDIQPLGLLALREPHFEYIISYAIEVDVPVEVNKDTRLVQPGGKYVGSTQVELRDLPKFVQKQGRNLMPLARALIFQYAIKREDKILGY